MRLSFTGLSRAVDWDKGLNPMIVLHGFTLAQLSATVLHQPFEYEMLRSTLLQQYWNSKHQMVFMKNAATMPRRATEK